MNTVNERISALRSEMADLKLDAVIIPSNDPHQGEYVSKQWQTREWITGFTGSAGLAVITQDYAGLWTDSRYFIQAESELAGSEVELHKQKIPYAPEHYDWLLENLPKHATIGIDGTLFSISQMERMEKKFNAAERNLSIEVPQLLRSWYGDTSDHAVQAFEHPESLAGKSAGEKINQIREIMVKKGATSHLITTLDDIAWTFNIRGKDVSFNPVVYAYALISKDAAHLFIKPEKVSGSLAEKMEKDGVRLHAYDAIYSFLANLSDDEKLLIDPAKTSIALKEVIDPACKIIKGKLIPIALKAIKNETEIAHIKEVMVRDGVALSRLYMWLEENLGKHAINECTVAEKLDAFRGQQEGYMGESFSAIAGFEGNGAIVHYRAGEETAAELKPEGMFLLDSGGQYLSGTTDITRTSYFGTPSAEHKRNYTLVLKGNLAVAMAKFPEGTRGNQLDPLARQFLWSESLNYGHGTGHGVGFFLNVHEGPQGISAANAGNASTPLVPGMLTSNEPGFYKAGEYGIRIENLVLVVEGEENDFGKFLEFETVSLFPIDLNLIELGMLTQREIDWLNGYHEKVYKALSPKLNKSERSWLKRRCTSL